jgi:hypothetical protein
MDTRAVAKEVQEQVAAAVQKSHERFRKGQDQVRKGRETVGVAVRAGNQLARAVMPSLPPLPKPEVHLPSVSDLTNPDKLRTHAHDLAGQARARQRKFAESAGQMITTQRKLAGKAVEIATPLVTEGVSRLSQVAGSLSSSRRGEHAGPTRHSGVTAVSAERASATPTAADTAAPEPESEPEKPTTAEASPTKASPTKASPTKASTAKPRTTRASTAKTGTAKPSTTTRASTAKASTAKANAAKPSTSKAKAARPAKTTTAKAKADSGDRATPKPREAKE